MTRFPLKRQRPFGIVLGLVALLVLAGGLGLEGAAFGQTQGRDVPQEGPVEGNVPGGHLGTSSDAEIWRAVREGIQGNVSIPDKKAGQLIQSEGDNWRAWRNGPISVFGGWALLGMIILIALFFAIRGRIKIDAGPSGKTMERFNGVERFAHWLTAVSFIVLALTGLNLLYGRSVLMPILGKDAFAVITQAGKYAHNFISFAFMVGVLMTIVIWVRHNIPNKHDLVWLAKGGGLFVKGVHPPSKKFNAGQKLIFWSVVVGGVIVSVTGISLLFPFQIPLFEPIYRVLGLAPSMSPMQEMQLAAIWHTVVGLVLIAVILAHIYIGSLGMEGAFDAMGSGYVDENWAREHHNLWVAEVKGEPMPDLTSGDGKPQPAE